MTTRTALGALATVLLLTPLAGCGIVGGGNSVVLVGDSLTVLVSDQVAAEAKADYDIEVTATWGVRIDEELDPAAVAAESSPDQVIINIGTNNVLQRHDTTASAEDLAAMLDLFDDASCLHLVTVNERINRLGDDFGPDAAAFNAKLREIAARRLNTHVIDWNQIVADHVADGIISEDSVHPTPAGVKLLADAYVGALRDC
ncbi:MAG: GDSL-type esterase/lipase family protein [Microthrixaceae bacterium]